ncbi:hypothetical protein DVS77_17855 [Mycolicibacterium moriokaense]|nr:hypothetical protein DVS77_17855 [Mycolicibacterium moriokaense]
MAALVLGVGVPTAGADTLPAQLKSATVKKTTLTYTFALQDTEDVGGIWLTVRERDNPDNVIVNGKDVSVTPIPGAFRDITRTEDGMPEGTAVCVSVVVWKTVHIGFNDDPSPPSNQICTDPEKTAAQADLALQNIRGKQDPLAPQTYAYLILVDNNSANEAKDVTVDLATSGVATFGDQGLVAAGWSANGFNCAPRPPVGGESSAISCTGGTVKAKDHIDPAVMVTFNSAGIGTIHAQVSGGGDTTPGNNGTALTLQPIQKTG